VNFIQGNIGVEALLSNFVPEELAIGRRFDVVFALSFFSHMPPMTFKRWLNTLMDQVEDQGIFIFTTHGRVGQARIGVTSLGEDGYWFAPLSEQRDLPTDDYGTMLVRPHFVFDALGHRTDCVLKFYFLAYNWTVATCFGYATWSAYAADRNRKVA